MIELTDDLARKLGRASEILTGLARAASKDCTWLQRNAELHTEILSLQTELREAAVRVTGDQDLGVHFREVQIVGTRLGELFRPARPES